MKLTPNAFEVLYQRCDPEERKVFFRSLAEINPAFSAQGHIAVPMPKVERLLTGYTNAQVKVIGVKDGAWDVWES